MTVIVGILLAAGSARRFGADKLMQPLADSTLVGVAAASNLIKVLPNSIAVVRPGDTALIKAFTSLGMIIVENPIAEQGMGTSLAAGIRASSDADGWLIVLADMPWIHVETIGKLANGLQAGASLVAPLHGGRRGHPEGFSSRWGGRLLELDGDKAASNLISQHEDDLQLQPTDDPGVYKDIDHPDDLASYEIMPPG